MENLIRISALRERIQEEGLGMITVFGVSGRVDVCSEVDYGEDPYRYYLNLDGNAKILTTKNASPIWQNLVEENNRPIYKITDPESSGWMEIMLYEK